MSGTMQNASYYVNAKCIVYLCILHRMSDAHTRLVWAREAAGFEKAADAARAMGVPLPTYNAHENGSRGFRRMAQQYASKYRVSLEWLLTGKGQPRPGMKRSIPVVGYVGAGAEVFSIDDSIKGAGIDEIEPPPGASSNAVAVKVRGDSMRPAFYDGDYIIYDDRREGSEIAQYLGRECVVHLIDGRTFIKNLSAGSTPGTWSLWSYNAAPIQDVRIEWAARVRWVERA
ncbi:S24 family peptidase [Xanthobacter flavus]|uniref:LexA family transcriptional regulator n=1 Tax=Xanthobacter flavus TaxID=281 RepID=UPI00372A2D56